MKVIERVRRRKSNRKTGDDEREAIGGEACGRG